MPLSSLRALSVAALIAFSFPTPALAAPPTKSEEVEAAHRFKNGLELMKDGDYQAALVEVKRAYALAPSYALFYTIGQLYFQLQDYPSALGALERYLKEGGSAIPATRRADVQADLDKLRARVANAPAPPAAPPPSAPAPAPAPVMNDAGAPSQAAAPAAPSIASPPQPATAPAPAAAPAAEAPSASAPTPVEPGPRGCGACEVAPPQSGPGALLAFALGGLALLVRSPRRARRMPSR